PIDGCRVEVLRRDLTPAGAGEQGEICIGGVGVARGYLHADESAAARFVQTPQGRVYRTCDVAGRRDTGELGYIGREVTQCKLGALCTESDEVRHALRGHPGVHDAAVRVDRGRLVAYVVPSAPGAAEPREVITWLEQRLPIHMVPMTYVHLDALPRTTWGKI